MSIGNEGEEKIPTHRELAALAKERDRQDKLAGKARARAKRVRSHVSGKDLAAENLAAEKLAAKYNGKKVGVEVVFGPEGATQFIFRRLYRRSILGPDGEPQFIFRRVKGGVAGWTVSLAPVTISGYDTQRELSKSGRGLLDKEKGEATLAFKAAEQLRACFFEIERLRKRQLLHRRQETLYIYPKPLDDTLRELREQVSSAEAQRDTEIESLIRTRDAISLAFEAFSKELGVKMQLAFDKLRNDRQWLQEVTNLRFHAVALANELQRPPTKAELRERYNSTRPLPLDESKFSPLLELAGLKWLKKRARGPNTHG